MPGYLALRRRRDDAYDVGLWLGANDAPADVIATHKRVSQALDDATAVWFSALDYEECAAARDIAREEAGRLREQLEALKRQQWSNQNRREVAERGHKAALARDFEQRNRIEALEAQVRALTGAA